jgi:hypothetical protein
MDVIVVGYTAITLTGMVVFGQQRWRQGAEVFAVWFGLLGRLARYASAGPPASGLVRRQRFPDGLVATPWEAAVVTLVAIGTGAILYDGLSQTEAFGDVLGTPDLAGSTLLLAAFLGIVVALALGVGTRIGMTAIGAGLVPVSVGYLVAHYLVYLLGDGQRILVAVADPLQRGWDLTGTAFFTPSLAWLSASSVWIVMFVAVVGGHLLGAWAGHHGVAGDGPERSRGRVAQVPLALVMVGLTTLTLWSLGQAVYEEPPAGCSRRAIDVRKPGSWLTEPVADELPARLLAERGCG